MAPSNDPKASGISTRDTGVFISRAAATTAGSKTAQAPTEFMKAESTATLAIVSAISLTSLWPATRRIQAPIWAATPRRLKGRADDQDRPHGNHRLVGEPAQRLLDRDDPAEKQGQQHPKRDQVRRNATPAPAAAGPPA